MPYLSSMYLQQLFVIFITFAIYLPYYPIYYFMPSKYLILYLQQISFQFVSQMHPHQVKQMIHIGEQYTKLKAQNPQIKGFAIVDDKGYPIIEQNIPRTTVIRNMMTICTELFPKGDTVTIAIEGIQRTLWLSEKENHYVMAILKANS